MPINALSRSGKGELYDSCTLDYMDLTIDEYEHAFAVITEAKEIPIVREISDNLLSLDDHQTLGHHEQTALAYVALTRRLGYSQEEQLLGAIIALIHDAGKGTQECQVFIQSTTAYRNLPSEQRIEADRLMHAHPEEGARMVQASEWDHQDKDIVVAAVGGHHWPTDGYGRQPDIEVLRHVIPLAVADNGDAMASERSYKDVFSRKLTKRLLYEKFSDRPEIVAAFFDRYVRSYQLGAIALGHAT